MRVRRRPPRPGRRPPRRDGGAWPHRRPTSAPPGARGAAGGAPARRGGAAGPYVVKADGLAAGKGVLVTESAEDAHAWVDRCLEGRFGAAGETVVIEEYLSGPEVSVFAVCAGTDA